MNSYRLTLNKCPHGVEMISLEASYGGGVRITGNKCCGRWTEIKQWPMNRVLLHEASEELECASQDCADVKEAL
jgi:hypothetical protein